MLLLLMVVGGGPCKRTPLDLGALCWFVCMSPLLRRLLSLTGMAGLEKLWLLETASTPVARRSFLGVIYLEECFLVRATAAPVTPLI